jgi:hypothetical protein
MTNVSGGARQGRSLDDYQDGETEQEAEQEILERALAEAELEADEELDARGTITSTPTPNEVRGVQSEPDASAALFPSLPTHQPLADPDDPTEADDDPRMALLLGLSGPSQQPGGAPVPPVSAVLPRQAGQGWNLPGWQDGRDEDLDSWCCRYPMLRSTKLHKPLTTRHL